jgi:hypothetical protein
MIEQCYFSHVGAGSSLNTADLKGWTLSDVHHHDTKQKLHFITNRTVYTDAGPLIKTFYNLVLQQTRFCSCKYVGKRWVQSSKHPSKCLNTLLSNDD